MLTEVTAEKQLHRSSCKLRNLSPTKLAAWGAPKLPPLLLGHWALRVAKGRDLRAVSEKEVPRSLLQARHWCVKGTAGVKAEGRVAQRPQLVAEQEPVQQVGTIGKHS